MTQNKESRNPRVIAKAGLWYTICNFIFKGMAFITTPIFARILSKAELGSFSNFSSWAGVLLIITSFDLSQSIIRSKLEVEDDIDSYVWSILAFSTLWTSVVYLVVCIFMPAFSSLLSIEPKFIHILFLYLFASPAYMMLITKHRAFYQYKTFVALTGLMAVSGTVLSLILVVSMQNKLAGRIYGYYFPQIIIGFIIFAMIAMRGKTIKTAYWKYAVVIMLPLVPHALSLYMLSASDKIIITKLCGTEYNAIYSIAYSAYHIVTILFDSMNKAWAPWLLESLHNHKYKEIMATSKKYIGIFIALILSVLILVPEIILVLGGQKYAGAVYCLPPLIASCVFQFIYTMYVNIEFYEKKTIGVSIATMIATVINIVLNLIFIPMSPEDSHIIASYTTLTGYIVLFVLHYTFVRRMKMDFVYDTNYILMVLAFVLIISFAMNPLYSMTAVRYCIALVYFSGVLVFVVKHKQEIIRIFKKA